MVGFIIITNLILINFVSGFQACQWIPVYGQKIVFYVGPSKEDIFFDHHLSAKLQSSLHILQFLFGLLCAALQVLLTPILFTCMVYFHHSTKDRNFDLAEVGIEPGAARWQSSALPSEELYDLKWAKNSYHNLMRIIMINFLNSFGIWQISWENMEPRSNLNKKVWLKINLRKPLANKVLVKKLKIRVNI